MDQGFEILHSSNISAAQQHNRDRQRQSRKWEKNAHSSHGQSRGLHFKKEGAGNYNWGHPMDGAAASAGIDHFVEDGIAEDLARMTGSPPKPSLASFMPNLE